MGNDQPIDAGLFKLFFRSDTYLAYARKRLPAGWMDGVDLTAYLA